MRLKLQLPIINQSNKPRIAKNIMQKQLLTITKRAASQARQLLRNRQKDSAGIKVGVRSGGCSGLSYFVEYADEIGKFDEVIKDDNITIIIDPKAVMYLIGSEMDYVEEEFKSGFIFTNPNEKARCGCGKSFNV